MTDEERDAGRAADKQERDEVRDRLEASQTRFSHRVDIGMGLVAAVLLASLISLALVISDFRGDTERTERAAAIARDSCRLAAQNRIELNRRARQIEARAEVQITVYRTVAKLAGDEEISSILRESAVLMEAINDRTRTVKPLDCLDAVRGQ